MTAILLDQQLFTELGARAASSPRRRTHHNLHRSLDEEIQRMVMAAEPDSYFRPHRHAGQERWELLICLRGGASLIEFSEDGTVTNRIELDRDGAVSGIQLPENTFHCMVIKQPGTVMLEVKRGPYIPIPETDFGNWSPAEQSPETGKFMEWLRRADVGERPPAPVGNRIS